MTAHISMRLAWHDDGWNGRICQQPAKNIHCVGCHSYPGEAIRETRDLPWEQSVAGQKFAELERIPACMYSGSAFAEDETLAVASPPAFFNDTSEAVQWTMPPATACTWPYEAMFRYPGIKDNRGNYDYEQRFNHAQNHFKALEGAKSLIFYYANYSNPFSTEEKQRYVLVGVSRVKSVGNPHFFINCSDKIRKKYHNGFVWQHEVTGSYPEQGVRLPYHLYKDDLPTAQKFVIFPEQTNVCKYGSKIVSDDEALGLVEQFLHSVRVLRDDIGDNSENWDARINWLETVIAQLWQHRGGYPGMASVLAYLDLHEAIDQYKQWVDNNHEAQAYQSVVHFLNGQSDDICQQTYNKDQLETLRRNALLKMHGDDNVFKLICHILPRFALSVDQISRIVGPKRLNWGISATLDQIVTNPYLLAEQYQGMDDSDCIVWSTIDRGCLPSPELSVQPLCVNNDKRRSRALLLTTIRRNNQHVFVKASQVLEQANQFMDYLPEWKRTEINPAYLKVDQSFYNEAIIYQQNNNVQYLYDALIYQDESELRDTFKQLLQRPTIKLLRARTKRNWTDALTDENSDLYQSEQSQPEYLKAIESQANACINIFNKPVALLAGGAGTGKSTVAAAYFEAVRQIEGTGSTICVLTPTGKAAERLRSQLLQQNSSGIEVVTIHSILAKNSWLNDNMTFKRKGGKTIEGYQTIIIDECSMVDTRLFAALNRAVNWNSVTRLLLVGDPAQLPPIGVGKIFADCVEFIRQHHAIHLVQLSDNLRQMKNRTLEQGTGIIDVAALFQNKVAAPMGNIDEPDSHIVQSTILKEQKLDRDELLQKLQTGGRIEDDLWVEYWHDDESLSDKIIELVAKDMANDGETAQQTWQRALREDVVSFQILSPVRGESFGTESINQACQKFKSASWSHRGFVDGFYLYDKVIQVVNRTKSNPINAWDHTGRKKVELEIFNGEIGTLSPKPAECKYIRKWPAFVFKDFCGKLVNKNSLSIEYFGGSKNKLANNVELAYAISVHKSQGSEFNRVYFVVPKASPRRQMMELIYTGITRASGHCTLLLQDNVSSLIDHARPERSALATINSSLFDFNAVPDELLNITQWYEAGKIHRSLMGQMLRSKSEVIVADLLFKHGLQPWYEKPLFGRDESQYLPDFTIAYAGRTYYWEHLGMLEKPQYLAKWQIKQQWYIDNGFAEQLIVSKDRLGAIDSAEIEQLIKEKILGMTTTDDTTDWAKIIELTDDDLVSDFALMAQGEQLSNPVWGYEVVINDVVKGQVELAWPDKKIFVVIDDDCETATDWLEAQDWNFFDMRSGPIKRLIKTVKAILGNHQ